MADLRKITMGEIAQVADIPKETARQRLKGPLDAADKSFGWGRYDIFTAVMLSVHAQTLRLCGIQKIAADAAHFAADSVYNLTQHPPHTVKRTGMLAGHYLIFMQTPQGFWSYIWAKNDDDAAYQVGEKLSLTNVGCVETAGFFSLNIGTVTDWALDRIFDIQDIGGAEATVPR